MKNYVLGFAFSHDLRDVLLINKTHPEWQASKLNGIGGHVEFREPPIEAMTREFQEETGLLCGDWEEFGVMEFPEARVTCYCTSTDLSGFQSMTEEKVLLVHVGRLECLYDNQGTIPNLRWLIPMAMWHLNRRAWPGGIFKYTGAPSC